nr:hypothetical protein [Tanacetum cinerariifolium]
MARLQFCDYHNMVAILEKEEFNTDFHPVVDFIAASPLRYALTIKPTVFVSHIRQFWSTARIETTKEGTHILATIDGIQRTVSEASLRHNLNLRDEDGIVSIPDTELFENLTLMGPKSTGFNEFSSNIATALVCLPAETISNDLEEIARVLTSMDAATVLAGETNVPTGSGFIPTAGPPATIVSTGSEVGPTASPIVRRRKGKEVMVESDTLKKKKLQEQIDA